MVELPHLKEIFRPLERPVLNIWIFSRARSTTGTNVLQCISIVSCRVVSCRVVSCRVVLWCEPSAYQQFGLQGTSFGTLKHIHIVALLEDEELIRSALAQLPTKLPCRTAAEILAPWGYAHKKPGKGLCLVPIAIQL